MAGRPKKQDTTFEMVKIMSDDVALIFKANGGLHVMLPKVDEDDVPDHIALVTLIMTKYSTDPDWIKRVVDSANFTPPVEEEE